MSRLRPTICTPLRPKSHFRPNPDSPCDSPPVSDGFDIDAFVARLSPEERELWDLWRSDEAVPGSTDGPLVRLWSFAHICMLELGSASPALKEELELHSDDLEAIRTYKDRRIAAERAKRDG